MTIEGWYYLHENHELIYKRDLPDTVADFRESDLVKGFWPMDPTNREDAWTVLIEAASAGANPNRIKELATLWQCDNEDAKEYANRIGVNLSEDGNQFHATLLNFKNLQEDPSGFGSTALEALAELCKDVGYRPSKLWGHTFKTLIKGIYKTDVLSR